jgi:N-sulfoglucosamine sulfohydrolase
MTHAFLQAVIRGATSSVIALALTATLMGGESTSARPNILLVTADDLGLQMGCYGDQIVHTPHLDRFAAQGIRFTRAFVTQASCSPSRSSMLTGLYPHQNGQVGLSHRGYSMYDPPIPTLPGELKKAGYRTGIIGKLHVNPESCFPFDFKRTDYKTARDVAKVATLAAEFTDSSKGTPFFLMVNFTDPHSPFFRDVSGHPKVKVAADQVTPFAFTGRDDAKLRQMTADYYCCVNRFDEGFGMLMDILKKSHLTENTLVVVIGDHGPPFPRAKVTCYEAGLQIPWLVRWPGTVEGAQVKDAFISTVDLMPTILEAANVNMPAGLAGQSLVPLLDGRRDRVRDYVFGEFTSHVPVHYLPQRTVRDERYKLCVQLLLEPAVIERLKQAGIDQKQQFQSSFSNVPAVGLYDLETDPHEFQNLADDPEYQVVLKKLQRALHDWRVATQDPLLDIAHLIALTQSHVGVHEKYGGIRTP